MASMRQVSCRRVSTRTTNPLPHAVDEFVRHRSDESGSACWLLTPTTSGGVDNQAQRHADGHAESNVVEHQQPQNSTERQADTRSCALLPGVLPRLRRLRHGADCSGLDDPTTMSPSRPLHVGAHSEPAATCLVDAGRRTLGPAGQVGTGTDQLGDGASFRRRATDLVILFARSSTHTARGERPPGSDTGAFDDTWKRWRRRHSERPTGEHRFWRVDTVRVMAGRTGWTSVRQWRGALAQTVLDTPPSSRGGRVRLARSPSPFPRSRGTSALHLDMEDAAATRIDR